MVFKVSVFTLLLLSLGCALMSPRPMPTAYPTYTPYPTATPYPTFTPEPDARLSVQVEIRDQETGDLVSGDVWLTFIKADQDYDILIEEDTSLVVFPLPRPDEADKVKVKVVADGYRLWVVNVRHQVISSRLLLLCAELESLDGA